jgi:hypothetical protein
MREFFRTAGRARQGHVVGQDFRVQRHFPFGRDVFAIFAQPHLGAGQQSHNTLPGVLADGYEEIEHA